jgi:MFS family permease
VATDRRARPRVAAPGSTGSLRADLDLLRQRRFALLFAGRTVSMFGNAFGPIAIAFGVLSLPGATPATLSVVLAGHAVPQLGLMLLGGVIGDRFPRHRVLVIAEALSGSAFAGLAAMLLTGWAPLGLLTGCAFVAGSASALLLPALTGVVPEVVERDRLQPANALLRLGGNTANIGGIAVAGAAVALLGPGVALAVDAATYFAAAALLVGVRPAARLAEAGPARPGPAGAEPARPGPAGPPPRPAPRRVLADVREGLREFAGRQWLWVVVVSAAFLNAGSAAAFGVLGPVLARDRLGGAVPWSIILAGYTAGMLSSVLAALRIRPARPLRTAALVTPLLAAPMLALGTAAPLLVVTLAAVCAGAALNVFSVLWETTLQKHVATDALARVTSCNYLIALSLRPIGIYLAGQAATGLGAGPTMLVLGAVLLLAGIVPLASPQVRQLPN